MKLIIITLYKLKMMLSDRLFFAAMILIPLFITIATGYALRYEKLNIIPVAIVDEDNSDYSKTLLERLSKKDGIGLQITDRENAMDALESSKVEAAFIIKKGFEENISRGEVKEIIDMMTAPSSFSSSYIGEVVAGEVIRFTTDNMAADWVVKKYRELKQPISETLADEVIKYTDAQWEPKPLMTINYQEMEGGMAKTVERVSMPAATATSAGIIVVFIMFYILFSSGWLIEEKRNGTLKRLVSGPDALGYSYMGSIVALLISGVLQIILFSLVDKLAFGVDLFPGVWSYVVFATYLLAVISISLFLSAILKTPAQLQAGAPVLALLTGFAGGCFWNFVEMPGQIKQLARFTPQGWALEGINRLLINSSDLGAIALPVAVLGAVSLCLLPLSYLLISRSVRN